MQLPLTSCRSGFLVPSLPPPVELVDKERTIDDVVVVVGATRAPRARPAMPITSSLRFLSPRYWIHSLSSHSSSGLVGLYTEPRSLSLTSPPPTSSSASMSTDSHSEPPLLVLGGKSAAENELAWSLKSNPTLKLPDGGGVSVRLWSELDKVKKEADKEGSSFDVEYYMSSLSTSRFGRLLIWSPRLSSTHDVVSHNFCELSIGSACVADIQIKGRGRSNNVWESPRGCLLFSFSLQMEDGRIVPLLQYVMSLAMTEAIKDICQNKGLPNLDVKIKWPNDLYLNGLKVGGILCTSVYKSKKFNVSAGIGLNVDNRQPTTCLNACLQEMASVSCLLQREEIMASFFNKFETFFDIFLHQKFQPLEELYYKTWLHSGQRVIVKDSAEGPCEEAAVTVQGLTSSGFLLAVGDDGHKFELHPDGNSFDFFKGLVRRKLD